MASYRKRGKTWQYIVEIGIDPVTGKRRQLTRGGFRTKKLAELAAADVEKQIFNGTFIEESDVTFGEFAPLWLDYYSKYVKASTMAMRRTSIKRLNAYMKHAKMRDVTKYSYTKILHDLYENDTPPNTIKIIHSTARLIFKYAVADKRIIKANPTENIDFRFMQKRTVYDTNELKDNEKYLEKEHLATFLKVAKDRRVYHPQDYIVYLTMAYSGLRRGELIVLKWSDIDLDNHTISVNKTFAYGETYKVNDARPGPPKTLDSERIIDIDDYVVQQLKVHKEWQDRFKERNGDRYTDLDHVFINTDKYPGYPIGEYTVYNNFKSILKTTAHPVDLAPHSFRHTHASLCIEAGIELRDIAERLGHTNMETLERIYAHTTKGQRKKVAKKFNEMMEKVRLETPF